MIISCHLDTESMLALAGSSSYAALFSKEDKGICPVRKYCQRSPLPRRTSASRTRTRSSTRKSAEESPPLISSSSGGRKRMLASGGTTGCTKRAYCYDLGGLSLSRVTVDAKRGPFSVLNGDDKDDIEDPPNQEEDDSSSDD